jgi:hypothetical protein
VDIINGIPGNELKCDNRKLVTTYLRVGFAPDGSWRTFGLRKDFHPASKLQAEDDITASVTVPPGVLPDVPFARNGFSLKFVENVERVCFNVLTTPSIAASIRSLRPTLPSRIISSPIMNR